MEGEGARLRTFTLLSLKRNIWSENQHLTPSLGGVTLQSATDHSNAENTPISSPFKAENNA